VRAMLGTAVLVTLILARPGLAAGQGPAHGDSAREAGAVRAARTLFARTNREQAGYRRVTRTVLGLSAEGADLVGLYDRRGELRKLEVTYFGESGRAVEHYYLDGGRPVFVFRDNLRYDRQFGRVVRHLEDRFYLAEGRLVRWIDSTGRRVPAGSAAFQEADSEVTAGLSPLLRALAQPDSTYEVEESSTQRPDGAGQQSWRYAQELSPWRPSRPWGIVSRRQVAIRGRAGPGASASSRNHLRETIDLDDNAP
jgi:hypothetical protein